MRNYTKRTECQFDLYYKNVKKFKKSLDYWKNQVYNHKMFGPAAHEQESKQKF